MSIPMEASASDGIYTKIEQIFYHLRFELLFTIFAILFWSAAQSLKRYAESQKKDKPEEFEVVPAPNRAGVKQIRAKQKPTTSQAVPASLRQRGNPDEIIRSYASADHNELRSMSEETLRDYFSGLFLALVRTGQVSKLRGHVTEAINLGMSPSPQQMESLAKMCTAKRHFSEALAAFDAAGVDPSKPDAATASSWSCLLFCAVESEHFSRCEPFYKALCSLRDPLCEDFMNMIRFIVHNGDQIRLDSLLAEVQKSSSPPDNIAYNRALSVCVAAGQLGMAEKLLADMQRHSDVCDVITYNTIIKGYVESGKVDRCFALFQSMKDHGITPSEVTYGILLDSCMGVEHLDRAAQIFKEFQDSGCKLNAVLYTTLLKGLSQT
jgi:pentatricopeptide repeat protein